MSYSATPEPQSVPQHTEKLAPGNPVCASPEITRPSPPTTLSRRQDESPSDRSAATPPTQRRPVSADLERYSASRTRPAGTL